ncbi:MAG: hypothetical protein KUG77_01400 [Nannocystaceae bacterium]|nr:hypothetical protein [Nannocystaceae bacterium]
MKRREFIVGGVSLVAYAGLGVASASAGQAFVVVHPRNPTGGLTKAKLKSIFLGKVGFWNGVVPVKLLVRPGTSSASGAFFPMIGMNASSFKAHWDKLQLSGAAMAPPSVGSASGLLGKIKSAPGAISFISAAEADSVDVLKKLKIS